MTAFQIIRKSEWSGMAESKYKSQKALAAIIPDNVVIPLAWGTFEGDKFKTFFITLFRDLRDVPPPPAPPYVQFLATLKKLHQTSVSPNGKFGFQVTTYNGPPKMVNDWTDSWEEYFARQFRSDVSFLRNVYGEDAELADLTEVSYGRLSLGSCGLCRLVVEKSSLLCATATCGTVTSRLM